jgi:hypothetical protein
MELAKAWFSHEGPTVPPEIERILLSHSRLEGLKLIRAIPELVTPLPERGEGRNHDLWILGKTSREQATICIEAKADEPFGNHTVAEYRDLTMRRREQGISTRASERIDALLRMVGGDLSVWGLVRYQLLTAICGTVLQAQKDGSDLAVFLVHEFRTPLTSEENLSRNKKDFELFVAAIGLESGIEGLLVGPLGVGGVGCLVGKVAKRND